MLIKSKCFPKQLTYNSLDQVFDICFALVILRLSQLFIKLLFLSLFYILNKTIRVLESLQKNGLSNYIKLKYTVEKTWKNNFVLMHYNCNFHLYISQINVTCFSSSSCTVCTKTNITEQISRPP